MKFLTKFARLNYDTFSLYQGTCNFVECEYGPWSVWTTTCGAGERARKLVPTQKTEKRASCDGLAQSCSKTPDVQKRTELCKNSLEFSLPNLPNLKQIATLVNQNHRGSSIVRIPWDQKTLNM